MIQQKVVWWDKPSVGDIVWCFFPELPDIEPGPKPRPVFVVKVFSDKAPQYYVQIAYGTSQKTDELLTGEFLIHQNNKDEYLLSGLSYSTKFNLNKLQQLPYNDNWFTTPPQSSFGYSPKLGTLHPKLLRHVQAAWHAINSTK